MRRLGYCTVLCLPVLLAASLAGAEPGPGASDIVPINGPAFRAIDMRTADEAALRLEMVPAANPDRGTWLVAGAARARYLAQEITPENVQVSRDGAVEGASRPVTDYSEVMVSIDPTNPSHLLAASKTFYRPESYGFFTGVFETYNAGDTWQARQPAGIEANQLTSDPVTAFDDRGTALFAYMTRGPTGIDVVRKPAVGSWQPPETVDRVTLTDKEWIAADQDPRGASPHAGTAYVSWTAVSTGRDPTRIVVARRARADNAWSTPVTVAEDDSAGVQGSIPAVGPDGTVYVIYGRGIFGGPGPGRLEVVRSRDGGRSFGRPAVAAEIRSIPFFLPNGLPNRNFRTPGSLPAFAVSPVNGHLFAAWADYRNGDSDIYFARSTDGGERWSSPVRLNDDPVADGIDQFQPQVSVAPNGRVAVMWFDRRLPCPDLPWIERQYVGQENACIDTFLTRSRDDGARWDPNIRVSAQTWDWRIHLPMVDGRTGFIGDYQGIASSEDFDYPVWNATADLGHNPDRRQQIFVARVPADWSPPAATPSATSTPDATRTATLTPTAPPTGLPSPVWPTPEPSITLTAQATGTATPARATGTPTDTLPPTGRPPDWSLYLPVLMRPD